MLRGKYIKSEEQKKKISLSLKGQRHTEERKKRIGLALKDKPWTNARREAQKLVRKTKKPYSSRGKKYSRDWHEIRRKIYERDKWICQECGCKCLDKKRKIKGRKIQCHHINFNKQNNNSNNLITLCASCHYKIGFSEKDWIKYYQEKIRKRDFNELGQCR